MESEKLESEKSSDALKSDNLESEKSSDLLEEKLESEKPSDSLEPEKDNKKKKKEDKKEKNPVKSDMEENNPVKSDMGLLARALDTKYGNTFKYFHGKGFWKYHSGLRSWMLIVNWQEILEIICEVVRKTPNLKRLNRLNNVRAWARFLEWYQVAEGKAAPAESRWLLSFRNVILDLKGVRVMNHHPENYCCQAVDAVFNPGPPTDGTMDYLFYLSGGDPLTLNLLCGVLAMIITGAELQIIVYLYGSSGSRKSTFMNLLLALGQGNAAEMSLAMWNSQFGRSSAQGAQYLLFDGVDYARGLSKSSATDLKKFVSGLRVLADRKQTEAVSFEGSQVVMTANDKLEYKKAPSMLNDDGWLRSLLEIYLKRRRGFVRDVDLLPKLLADAGGIIAWDLAFPPECLTAMGTQATFISKYMEKVLEQEGIDNLCKQFFFRKTFPEQKW